MIIYGWKTFRKVFAEWEGPCCNCLQHSHQGLLRDMKWFTLMWIPLFPFHIKRQIVCSACGADIKVTGAQAKAIAAGVPQAQAAGQQVLVNPFVPGYIGFTGAQPAIAS